MGSGLSIDLWRDPWLTDEGGRFVQSTAVDELRQVSDIIDKEKWEWDVETIEHHFNKRDRRCILAIPIICRHPRDKITWAYSKDGEYGVKTSYMLGKSCNFDSFHQAFVELRKMELSPKFFHFLWRLCTETLSVRDLLKRRHLTDAAGYPWCETDEETVGTQFLVVYG